MLMTSARKVELHEDFKLITIAAMAEVAWRLDILIELYLRATSMPMPIICLLLCCHDANTAIRYLPARWS